MTTKNHYYKELQLREAEVAGNGLENKYSRLAEGGAVGIVIYLISSGLIALFTSNIGVFKALGYGFVGTLAVTIACIPILILIAVLSKVMAKENVYGRQPEIEGY